MNFTLNYIDPVAFQLGPIAVRWYGIIIACGILLGYFIAQRTLQRVGFDKDVLVDILFGVRLLALSSLGFTLLSSNFHIMRSIQRKYRRSAWRHRHSRRYYRWLHYRYFHL